MNWSLFPLFCVLNVVNVILQTVKSIATIKCGKFISAIVNAVAYGLYTIVLVYTVCDLPLFAKAGVVAGANLIGVYVVKLIEEKQQKDKMWKIEVTAKEEDAGDIIYRAAQAELSYNYSKVKGYYLFNFYCNSKEASRQVREILKKYPVKYFVMENKGIL